MNSTILQATLQEKKNLTPTVLLITLALKEPLSFRAGQHVVIHIPTSEGTAERPFSVASPPSQGTTIQLLVKLIQGGLASTFFEQQKIGSTISLSGPRGKFTFLSHKNPVHFIASSTGIAPIRSMIHNILLETSTPPIHVTLGASNHEEILLKDELYALAGHKKFTYSIVVHERPSDYPDVYLKDIASTPLKDFYLCGGPNFVDDIKRALLKRGVPENSIHYEEFK